MAAHGFGDEVLAFDGNEASGRSAGSGEGGAQLLDARVLAAGDETWLRAEGAGGHRGDFTLPGSSMNGSPTQGNALCWLSRAFPGVAYLRHRCPPTS
jgi:hypothetical protein